ncbi:uncharacterized protein TNCT_498091 [Trichonephila clavata]|uniref:Uncharacterized protein n=1 Tax=Trichonephila clavata TaxID=2740835 RepID=A0A8X6JC15_TRICU|nr:uncharacterized protein TNCT_498091 [Trichonephila clavata]
MRTLQASKKHLTKKWRSRSCSESTSDSCSSSSDSEGGSSQSSATAEREFSIVKESNFANGPLKLKIAARKVKKDVANGAYDQDDSVDSPPLGSDSGQMSVGGPSSARVVSCTGESSSRKQRCKRKIEKVICLA